MAADVRRLREVQAKADIGGERCLEMLPCPLQQAGAGDRAGVGGVPGGSTGLAVSCFWACWSSGWCRRRW